MSKTETDRLTREKRVERLAAFVKKFPAVPRRTLVRYACAIAHRNTAYGDIDALLNNRDFTFNHEADEIFYHPIGAAIDRSASA